MKIAILLATFNRKDKTLKCLANVKNQALSPDYEIEIFLTDDASPDGTRKAVQDKHPEVHVFKGTGSLFWAGGMRSSWREAIKKDFDYFLLLNDDTFLLEDAIKRLVESNLDYSKKNELSTISIGTTLDPDSGEITYGGRKLYSKNRIQSYLVNSRVENMECELGNANAMLVPNIIVEEIGILSGKYLHSISDYDYTLRTIKAGFKVVVAPGIYGYCSFDHGQAWPSVDSKLSERLSYLYSIKGLNYHDYLTFIKSRFPLQLPAAFVKLWVKTLVPIVYDRFKKPEKIRRYESRKEINKNYF